MPWPITSLKDREERLRAGIAAGLKLTTTPGRMSNIGVISAEVAGEIDDVHQHIAWQAAQRFTRTANEEGLINIAAEFGMTRHAPQAAVGQITVTGTNGATLEAGSRFQDASGAFYATDSEVTIAAETATVAATAETAGTAGNIAAGTSLSLVSPVAGIAATATVSTAFTEGREIEDIEAFRSRILFRQANPPMGGSDADYVRFAFDVAGVTHAWVTPMAMGLGTVTVRIAAYDDPGGPVASETLRSRVADRINGYVNPITNQWEGRPATAQVFVVAAGLNLIDIVFDSLTPTDSKTIAAIAANIQALFRSIGEPGVTVRHSWIGGAISAAVGENYHKLATPAGDVICGTNEMPFLSRILLGTDVLWEAA